MSLKDSTSQSSADGATIDTLESVHNKISLKLTLIFNMYRALNMDVRQVDEVRTRYQTDVTDILIQYYDSPSDTDDLLGRFVNIISTENYLSIIDSMVHRIKSDRTINDAKINAALADIALITINTDSRNPPVTALCGSAPASTCDCINTQSQSHDNVNFCAHCGTVGTSPSSSPAPVTNVASNKRTHRPNKHYDLWMNRLQGKDSVIDDNDFKRIKGLFQRDGVPPYKITPPLIRQYLQEAKLTTYNNKTSKLYIMLTNKKPYNFTYQEDMMIGTYFNVAMDIFDSIKGSLLTNKRYYPYFIYKIIEEKFANRPDVLTFLSFIHLQSEDTVVDHDTLYRRICDLSDGQLVYTPTRFYK